MRPFGRAPFSWGAIFFALLCASTAWSGDFLARGNQAFREGKFDQAASIYEGEEDSSDLLTRRFNAGVSWQRAGSLDKAMERFEEVSARAEGDLRRSAFYNAGCSYFQNGKAIAQDALKIDDLDERAKKLAEAAKAYYSAARFFREVDPSGEDAAYNLSVTKTALRGVLDQINRIQEEKKKKAEEEALKSPPQLIHAILLKERQHRALSRSFARDPGSKLRLEARQLRKAEAENRALAEKLHHHLTSPAVSSPGSSAGAQPSGGQPAPPGPSEEEKARNARAAAALQKAIAAQQDAEVAYSKQDMPGAGGSHTKAIQELRSAMEVFPLELPAILGEGIATEEAIHSALDGLLGVEKDKKDKGGKPPAPLGFGKAIVDALKDKVLEPLAKLVSPQAASDAKAMADDEDDVVWVSKILSQAGISAPEKPPANPAGPPQPPRGPDEPQELTPEKAKALSEALQREGKEAHEASSKAKEDLSAGRPLPALPEAKRALDALKRAADLLPKPPEPPEARLKRLLQKQEGAREASGGLAKLQGEARSAAQAQLSTSQREDGREAGEIAVELEKRPDEPARKAAPKVREGEAQIFSSAEALSRERLDEGKVAIEKDIKALEEALALLQGKDQEKQHQDQEQKKAEEQPSQKQDSKKEDNKKEKEDKSRYALTPREARLKEQEMDRQRREEEGKIFSAPSRMTVEKDW
jgi:hypothetical protein